ncbi:hypothetical protein BDF20DRAFT_901730 [Mycotypha africana]|uniref:uncharacterized protein n=1 Tax=Mycotypha africana TaxID=64632 RepID=UPI002301DB9E|nr:uncharacterized protein BDF20DRAFT_901730 [Mycotypha africana]KAI8967300.1 hypothetical protein BDF20DRAFT_901730 [Mycotypha africana]
MVTGASEGGGGLRTVGTTGVPKGDGLMNCFCFFSLFFFLSFFFSFSLLSLPLFFFLSFLSLVFLSLDFLSFFFFLPSSPTAT